MGRFRRISLLVTLVSASAVSGAERITVTKTIPASAGPWAVTLSINDSYRYGNWQSAPIVFSSADGFGIRAGDVLTIQYVEGLWCASTYVSTGTCVDADGYRNRDPVNDRALNGTVYAPSKYIDRASYPVLLMQLVSTFTDSRGQIVGTPFKVGNGPVDVTVPEGADRLQLGSNMWSYVDARNFFTPLKVGVTGPPPPVMKTAGAMSQLAVGGIWRTSFVLMNSGTAPAQVQLDFLNDDGLPLALPLSFPETPSGSPAMLSTVERTLAAGASLVIESAGQAQGPEQTGWARLATDGSVTGFAIYGQTAGEHLQEVAVPLETRSAGAYALWFDHTGGVRSGLALANLATKQVAVAVTIRDEDGAKIGDDSIPLPAQGHASFMAERWTETAGRRGIIEFRAAESGRISMLGLRANGFALTAMPVVAK